VLRARNPERLCCGNQRIVAQLLVTELNNVDPTAQRRVERLTRARVEDEVEARARKTLTAGGPVHRVRLLAHVS
jgi:hypothetical protein